MNLDELVNPGLGLDLDRADAINNSGVILASARGDFEHFYLLTPMEIPEPELLALLIPGLLVMYRLQRGEHVKVWEIGGSSRRRRRIGWPLSSGNYWDEHAYRDPAPDRW
jgi:hypothetical protein